MKAIWITRLLQWVPRILAIAFMLFVSLFALDVFSEKDWLLALLIHLLPTYILIFFTVIAWKWNTIGGTLFMIGGIAFMAFSRFEGYVIALPMIIIGVLFVISGWLVGGTSKHMAAVRSDKPDR